MSIVVVGNVGKDPEVKYFESGAVNAKFSVADKFGSTKDHTEWRNVELWGKAAEVAANYVRKGSLIAVSGELVTEEWDDKEGNKRSKVIVKSNVLKLLGKAKADGEEGEESNVEGASAAPKISKSDIAAKVQNDEDIPF